VGDLFSSEDRCSKLWNVGMF